MSQTIVLQLLKELGGKATLSQLRTLAKSKHPYSSLPQYMSSRLSTMAKHGLVVRQPHNVWEIVEASPVASPDVSAEEVGVVVTFRHGDVVKPSFFEKEGIKSFELDEEVTDFYQITDLAKSLRDGYDEDKPIVVSQNSSDPALNGEMIDGRHRCAAIQWIEQLGNIPVPVPTIRYEVITDLAHLESRQIYYELHNQSKNVFYSKQRIERQILNVLRANPELDTLEKAIAFFKARDLLAENAITLAFAKHRDILQRERRKTELLKAGLEKELADPTIASVSQL